MFVLEHRFFVSVPLPEGVPPIYLPDDSDCCPVLDDPDDLEAARETNPAKAWW